MNDCQVKPNQNIKKINPKYNKNSLLFKSKGILFLKKKDKPKRVFIQVLKKKVGTKKYKIGNKIKVKSG